MKKNIYPNMKSGSPVAQGRLVKLQPRYLIPILLLLLVHASETQALGASLHAQQQSRQESYDPNEPASDLTADTHQVALGSNPPLSPSNTGVSQAAGQNWSEPVLLFEVSGVETIQEPNVLSDLYGNVHVLWLVQSQTPAEPDAIYYRRLDAMGWTTPVDIVIGNRILAVDAVLTQGFIYLIWNSEGDLISYSRAPIQAAESAANWSRPTPLTEAAQYASVAPSPSGDIFLAYAAKGNKGVYEQVIDSSRSVSYSPKIIAQNSLINTGSDYVQMEVSSNGTMHVVWTEFYLPDFWPPRGIFYARSTDSGDTWSLPTFLGGGDFDQITLTILDDNNIHAAWNGRAGLGGRYHSWSSDGGLTWSDINMVIPAGLGGTEGPPEILGDHEGIIHMLTTYEGCAWYTYFENQRWANPVCISGERARASNFIEQPAMAISEGNKLHAVFWDDRKRLWYATKVSQASWIPPQKMENAFLQTVLPPTPSNDPVVTPVVTPTSWLVEQQLDTPPSFSFTTGQILILSLSPAILMIILVAVSIFYKRIK